MSDPIHVVMVDDRSMDGERFDHVPAEKYDEVKRAIQRAFDSGESASFEYRNPDDRWWQIRVVPVEQQIENGTKTAVIFADITESKRIERETLERQKRFRLLAAESSLAEEKERKRISTELHDRIGQPLLALKMMIGSLRDSIDTPELKSSIDKIENLLGSTIQDTRSLTFELSPQILYMLGFEAAIEWLAEQNEKRYAIPFAFHSEGLCEPLGTDLEVFLFQAVRELLSNVGKHAHASKASVIISRTEESVKVSVEDDGVGFDVFRVNRFENGDKGFGLFSIRERLSHLGGRVSVISKTNQGTRITLIAPLTTANHLSSRETSPG